MNCTCGSGLEKRPLIDARGIFCTYVCDSCEKERKDKFRPEIFKDAKYETSEPIEEEL